MKVSRRVWVGALLGVAACAPAQRTGMGSAQGGGLDASANSHELAFEGGLERPAIPVPDEPIAYRAAAPALQRWCVDCHSASGPRADRHAYEELAMDHYPYGGRFGPVAGLAVAEVIGATGLNPTMPVGHIGQVPSDDLKAIVTWAVSFSERHPFTPPPRRGVDGGAQGRDGGTHGG